MRQGQALSQSGYSLFFPSKLLTRSGEPGGHGECLQQPAGDFFDTLFSFARASATVAVDVG
jgi:hypothetical protein